LVQAKGFLTEPLATPSIYQYNVDCPALPSIALRNPVRRPEDIKPGEERLGGSPVFAYRGDRFAPPKMPYVRPLDGTSYSDAWAKAEAAFVVESTRTRPRSIK